MYKVYDSQQYYVTFIEREGNHGFAVKIPTEATNLIRLLIENAIKGVICTTVHIK